MKSIFETIFRSKFDFFLPTRSFLGNHRPFGSKFHEIKKKLIILFHTPTIYLRALKSKPKIIVVSFPTLFSWTSFAKEFLIKKIRYEFPTLDHLNFLESFKELFLLNFTTITSTVQLILFLKASEFIQMFIKH